MKFKSNIELQAGLEDNNAASGTTGQVLSSTGTGVEWIDQAALTDTQSNFVYFDVKNETGSTINKGKGVMAVGTDGNSGHILIDEMVADGTVEPKYFLGVLEEDIANGGFARVISFGQLAQFNTNGQNGETWNDGQVLWCDPANPGDFTITEPDGPNVKISAAFILNSSTNGKIQVRVQANEGVHDLHDTKITSQVDGDVLVWDNTTGVWFNDSTLNVDYTNGRVGIGTTNPGQDLEISGQGNVAIRLNSTDSTTSTLQFADSDDVNVGMIQYHHGGNYMSFRTNDDERMRITSAGNVGIGTTNPNQKLQVNGDVYSTLGLYSDYDYSGNRNWRIITNSFGSGNWGGIAIQTSTGAGLDPNTTRFGIDYLGNVGIGTTSPGYKLDVNGNIRGTGTSQLDHLKCLSTLSFGTFTPGVRGTQFEGYSTHSVVRTDAARLNFYMGKSSTGVGTMMSLTDTGRVGIGTTNPTEALMVEGWIRVANNTGIKFNTSASSGDPTLNIDSSAHWNFLNTAGNNLLKIDNGGNVGIGTTNPGRKLSVAGAIELTSSDMTIHTGHAAIRRGSSGEMFLDAPGDISVTIDTNNNNTDRVFNVRKDTGSELFRVQENGNVGIGTTSPSRTLSVNGSVGVDGNLYISSALPQIQMLDTDGTAYSRIRSSNGGLLFEADENNVNDDTNIRFEIDSSEKLRIDSSGNVGIGTTSPSEKLSISGAKNTSIIHLGSTTNNSSWVVGDKYGAIEFGSADGSGAGAGVKASISYEVALGVTGSTNSMVFRTAGTTTGTNNTSRMVIDSAGNVGIGTTDPSDTLTVDGTTLVTGTITSSNGAGGGLRLGNSDYRIEGGTYFGDLRYTAPRHRWYEGSNLVMTIDGDNVGIGMSSPGYKLDVAGNARFTSEINMEEDHYINLRFEVPDNANSEQYILLCRYAGGNDVNGTITMDRTSGLRHACSVDIIVSAGSSATPVGGLRAIGTSGGGNPKYNLVTCYLDGVQYVALEIENPDLYYESTGAYFTGRIKSTGVKLVPKLASELTSIADFEANTLHTFSGDASFRDGNVGIGTTSPEEKLDVYNSVIIQDTDPGTFQQSTGKFYLKGKTAYDMGGGLTVYPSIWRQQVEDVGIMSGSSYLTIGCSENGGSYSEKLRINSFNGNVGIGMTNPGAKLEVSGNIKLSETAATTDTDKFVVLDAGVIKYRTGAQVLSDLGVPSSSQNTNVVGSYSNFGQPYAPGGGTSYDVDATAAGTSFHYTPSNGVYDWSALAPSGTWKFRSPMPGTFDVALVQRIA